MGKNDGENPGWLKKFFNAYWRSAETISGKKAADSALRSFSAYAKGDFAEGARLGLQSNAEAVSHYTGAINGAVDKVADAVVGNSGDGKKWVGLAASKPAGKSR